MKDIKILIVEDEVLIAEHIKDYLTGFGFSEIYLAHSKNAAFEAIEHLALDLILLDLHLQLPKDGLDIARYLDDKNACPYIFITANADILIVQEAIKTNASGYITKPIKKEDLFANVQLALKSTIQPTTAFLLVKENNETFNINYDEILFIESNSNYIIIHTKNKKVNTRQSLDWAESELSKSQFIRIHRSFIINLHAVEKMNVRCVYINNIELPISRTYHAKVSEYVRKRQKQIKP